METSPVPPEWKGIPNVIFISETALTMTHDFEQTPIHGLIRVRFIQLVEKYIPDWYITALVKCRPASSTYSTKAYNSCTPWISEEVSRVRPKIIVGCGSKVEKYIKCDYITMSPTRIVQSKKNEEIFEGVLKEIQGKLNGSKS